MAETRLVPVIFQGHPLPGIQVEVSNHYGIWVPNIDTLLSRSNQIKAAIRQVPGLVIPAGYSSRMKEGSATGNSIEYELYNIFTMNRNRNRTFRLNPFSPITPPSSPPRRATAAPVMAAPAVPVALDPHGKPLVPVLNGAQQVPQIDIDGSVMNIIDQEDIANGDDIVHFLVGGHNYYYKTVTINEWFNAKSEYAPLQLPERLPIANRKLDPTPLAGVVIRRGIARVNPAGGKRRNRKTNKKSKKRKTTRRHSKK